VELVNDNKRLEANWLTEQKTRMENFQFLEAWDATKAKVRVESLESKLAALRVKCERLAAEVDAKPDPVAWAVAHARFVQTRSEHQSTAEHQLTEARALLVRVRQIEDYDYVHHMRPEIDAFLARTATGEGEQRTALRSQIIRTDHGNSFRVLSLPDAQFGFEGVANVVWVAGPATSRELWHWGVPEKMLGGEGDEASAMSAATEWLLDMTTRGEQP
jgi:hypothetical protein